MGNFIHSFFFFFFFFEKKIFIHSWLGMAKWTRPAGTRPDPTLMGRVLSDPFNIRVGSGFSLKNPKRVRVGFGYYAYPTRTRPVYIIFKKKKKKTLTINTHFSPKSLRPILSTLSFSPKPPAILSLTLTLILTWARPPAPLLCLPCSLRRRHSSLRRRSCSLHTSPAPLHSPPRCLLDLAAACRHCCSSLTSPGPPPPHKAATFSSPSFCSKNLSFCSKNQSCNF